MDIRKASKPQVVHSNTVGTSASKFSTGEQEEQFTTPPSTQELTPTYDHVHATPTDNDEDSVDEAIAVHRTFLKDKGIEDTTIFEILDMLLTGEEVMWQFDLLSKIPIVFRVRPQWVDRYLIEELERVRPSNVARFTDLVSCINLAGSMVRYKDRNFKVVDEDSLKDAMQFLGTLPFVIQKKLVDELAIFDRVMIVATSDWAVSNFSDSRSGE